MPAVLTGLERVVRGEVRLPGTRIGLIANPTSIDSELRHAADLLRASSAYELSVLFGPEHGLRGDAQDMIAVATERDTRTGLPVHSLYGADESSLEPPAGSLDGLDLLVFDIQDVGSRYYTYVWTMVYAMRACARAGVAVAVLDRPNPIGGELIEGGLIAEGYQSFVGLGSVPNRHGMTAGEIARFARETENLDVELHVIEMQGWRRPMSFADTGLPWVLPSPNMPTYDTALVYPGMCLVEGTELSEARGTTRPFELAGAPHLDGYLLADALEAEQLPGVRFRPHTFTPGFQKHAGTQCHGIQLHVTDPRAFRPYLTGVAFVRSARALDRERFAWRTKAYEFVDRIGAFDLLTGSAAVREAIEAEAELRDIAATWAEDQAAFAERRQRWLIYG